ncbi:MAG: hypothetical protein KG075_10560 [Alphaproteobacteria bacterium]|nr:hypothetical protein [Alphaproteobacteria bacterium]
MPVRRTVLIAAFTLLSGAALAHHGWGSYDSGTVLTLDGTVAEIDPNNPHGELKLKTADKLWIVTLSPPSRMAARGKPITEIKTGDKLVAVGYPSRSRADEMRAERVTHNGFTVELR